MFGDPSNSKSGITLPNFSAQSPITLLFRLVGPRSGYFRACSTPETWYEVKVKSLDFLVIGAAKAGTTALFHYLRPHPQIFLPAGKEIPFFDDDIWFHRGWEAFAREFFAEAPLDSLWGKITPRYMRDPRVAERLYSVMPQLHVIAILRNPVDRAYSHYRMLVRMGQEQRPFGRLVADQLQDDELTRARTTPLPGTSSLLAQGEYGRILKQYVSIYPPEQLLVHFADDLEQRPQVVIDSILKFLGLEPGYVPVTLGSRFNVGGSHERFPWLVPLARRLAPLNWLWARLPGRLRRTVLLWFTTQANVVTETPQQIPPSVRSTLVNFYRPDVRGLEILIDSKVPWREFREAGDDSGRYRAD